MRETCCIFSGIDEQFLLSAELLSFAIRDQSIGDVAESALNDFLIKEHGVLLLCFGETDIRAQPAGCEDWLCQGGTKSPESSRSSKQGRKCGALITRHTCQRNLGEIQAPGDSNLGVRRD